MLIWPKKCSVKAKLSGQTLIAAFRVAHPPLVWQFDLEKNHSFTVALQGEEGDLELGVTSPRGEFYPIAHFADREDAEEAFRAVQKALLSCRSRLAYGARVIAWLIAVAVILFFVFAFFGKTGIKTPAALTSTVKPVEMPSGVPLPADDVLRAPMQ